MSKLTPKQARFCAEYTVDLNAKQAAIRAGYSTKGAKQTGFKLLTQADLQNEIQARINKQTEHLGVTQQKVIAHLAAIAFQDPRELYEVKDGQVVLKDSAEWPEHAAATVSRVKSVTTTSDGLYGPVVHSRAEVKQHDPLRALEMLGRYLKLFEGQQAQRPVQFTIDVGS
jgi:phage terminase small subunit